MVESGFYNITSGEESLLQWILEHTTEEGTLKESLPDTQSVDIVFPELKGINFVDGMLDGIIGESIDDDAHTLLALFAEFAQNKFDRTKESDEAIDLYLGRIYIFIIQHRTLSYIDKFLELLREKTDNDEDKKFINYCILTARQFLIHGIHREAIKFGLAIYGLLSLNDDELRMYCAFGLADEFALFVAVGLSRHEYNDKIFYLAKCVKGWGRISYINHLKADNQDIRTWLLLEGYKCDIGIDHIALDCLNKADLKSYIKEFGWSDKLYDAVSDMFEALSSIGKHELIEYKDVANTLESFVKETSQIKMNIKRFANLLTIYFYVEDENIFDEAQKAQFLSIMQTIAYESSIDWEGISLCRMLWRIWA